MAALTHEDLHHVRALWEEWTSGLGYDLDIQVLGQESAGMDPDRALGAILTAKLSLRIRIIKDQTVVFDEGCPYDGRALRLSIGALARTIANRQTS